MDKLEIDYRDFKKVAGSIYEVYFGHLKSVEAFKPLDTRDDQTLWTWYTATLEGLKTLCKEKGIELQVNWERK